ncbi:uncharacterized protein LOC129575834 [Sitodiplosis mosellana]|uniref:uncharacterized protein LOC129575834 n=1 Tax=Sitodiplosis mosellana TaxID=263140 RepID=UPI002443D936|nr:uncharacterized protein LOC129575834 [Sitodiplosis mosellana]
MKLILIFTLCCVAVAKGDFFDKIGQAIEHEARCAVVKTAQVAVKFDDETNGFDRLKISLLELQCDMGLDIDPDLFLVISYIVILIIAFFVLIMLASILKCICRTLFCCGSEKPKVIKVYNAPPYNRLV